MYLDRVFETKQKYALLMYLASNALLVKHIWNYFYKLYRVGDRLEELVMFGMDLDA